MDEDFGTHTEVLAPTSFLLWWENAAQRQVIDLIRALIEILVPFTHSDRLPEPMG